MEFLTDILGGVASVASGGLLGLLGSVVGAGFKYLERRQKAVEQREERAHELDLIRLQMEQGDRETENELKIVEANTSAQVRTSSYQMPITVQNVPGWVNAIRSLFRPFLTLLLNGMSCAICFMLLDSLDNPTAQINVVLEGESVAADLLRYTSYSIMFASNTATVWWFGDRALSPPDHKNR